MIDDQQKLNDRMDLDHDNYMEVELREQYLFEEKLKNYKLKREQDK